MPQASERVQWCDRGVPSFFPRAPGLIKGTRHQHGRGTSLTSSFASCPEVSCCYFFSFFFTHRAWPVASAADGAVCATAGSLWDSERPEHILEKDTLCTFLPLY